MKNCDDNGLCVADVNVQYSASSTANLLTQTKIKILFFTDPICSHCWAIEPAWRKLMALYESQCEVSYVHGGLLPGWKGFQDRGNGISKPSDVALHWQDVARHYGQPINPSVWLDDPIESSYPSCLACLAIRVIDPAQETRYLRLIREAVFLHAKNIGKDTVLADCAEMCGVDRQQFLAVFRSTAAQQMFANERQKMANFGMRGFPSLLIIGNLETMTLRGSNTFEAMEQALIRCGALRMNIQHTDIMWWVSKYQRATTREIAEATKLSSEQVIGILTQQNIKRQTLADSDFWTL